MTIMPQPSEHQHAKCRWIRVLRRTITLTLTAGAGLSHLGCVDTGEALEMEWVGNEFPVPWERPDVTLTATDGSAYDFRAETEGKVVFLFFGYTYCPDICPVHMANLSAVLRDMPFELTRHIEVVFVTTDPERDTPERLRSWLDAMGWPIVGLRGTNEEVNAFELALGLSPSYVLKGEDGSVVVGHTARVIAFGADGPARLNYPFGTRQQDWRFDVPKLVRTTVEGFEG